MKKNIPDIDKLFKTALDNQEETPSKNVWDALDQQLDKNKVVDINRKYVQLKRVAVALIIILIGIGAYTLSTWNKYEELAKNSNPKKDSSSYQIPETENKIKITNNRTAVTDATTTRADKDDPLKTTSNRVENKTANNVVKLIPNEAQQKIVPSGILQADDGKNNNDAIVLTHSKNDRKLITNKTDNIIINKRAQKTNITNAGYGIEEDETANNLQKEKVDDTPVKVIAWTAIHPELIRAASLMDAKKGSRPGYPNLSRDIIAKNVFAGKKTLENINKFSVTVFYSPDFSTNRVKQEEHIRRPGGQPVPRLDKNKIRDKEQEEASMSSGLLIDYKLSKHWSVQSGIAISNKKITIEPKTIYAHKDNNGSVKYLFDCSSGYTFLSSKSATNPAVGDSIKALASVNTLQYAVVPLMIKYKILINRFDLFTSLGASLNILTRGQIKTELESNTTKDISVNDEIKGLKSKYLSGNIGIGASFAITDKIGISFLPSYNFALVSSTKNAAVKSFPNSFSLGVGIRYRL